MTRYFALAALIMSTACLEVKNEDTSLEPSNDPTDTADTGDDTGTVPTAPMNAYVSWDADGALLTIENADPTAIFQFGIAETNGFANNAEATDAGLWTAEDCNIGMSSFQFCHELDAVTTDGYAALELISVGTPSEVSETGNPQNTLLNEGLAPRLTYILDDFGNGVCYVWGNVPGYYDDYYYLCEYMPEWD